MTYGRKAIAPRPSAPSSKHIASTVRDFGHFVLTSRAGGWVEGTHIRANSAPSNGWAWRLRPLQGRGGWLKVQRQPDTRPLFIPFGDFFFFFYRTNFRQSALREGQRCALRLAMPRSVPWPRQLSDMRPIGQCVVDRRRLSPRCRLARFSGLFSLPCNDAARRRVMSGNMGTCGTYIQASRISGISVAKSCSQPRRLEMGTLGTIMKDKCRKNRALLLPPSRLPGARCR